MNLQNRIEIIGSIAEYLSKNENSWKEAKNLASYKNPWFTENFIDESTNNIITHFLNRDQLRDWVNFYHLDDLINSKIIGIVMAGNIPMVGFHDFLCTFITGHQQKIKLSSKDDVLLQHIINQIFELNPSARNFISIEQQLKGCDAYITTGGNQSAQHFEQYFSKYPSIIRKNRTSVAVLDGTESEMQLKELAKDVFSYFGLGCRNVTKIFVPKKYDFIPLIDAFKAYDYLRDYKKYADNYDFQLSLLLLNNIKYMSSESVLLVENEPLFSPLAVLNYEYYENIDVLEKK
jgi:hypothetical protein